MTGTTVQSQDWINNNDNGGIITMKKYLVSWTDRGASHNGVFYTHNMKELREQTEYLVGRITSIDLLEE